MIIAILNCDKNWGIGKKNGLLFHLPKDMKFFRDTTLNHVVALGEKTLLSFPNARPLKNRTHIVLSSDKTHNYENVINVHTLEDFLQKIKEYSLKEEVYIIGGASIYNQTLPYVDKVLLTKVNYDGKADVFFPPLDNHQDFELKEQSDIIQDEEYQIQFLTYYNKNKKEIE